MSCIVRRDRWLGPILVALGLAVSACGGPPPPASPAPLPIAAKPGPAKPVARKPGAAKPTAKPAPRPAGVKRPAAPGRRTPPPAQPRVKVDSTAMEFAITAQLAHRPLARALARRTRNPEIAERAAWALVREAGRHRVSPSLLAAVLLIENRQLDSSAVSSQGAIGLMQVMPIHAGGYGCGSADLRNVDSNICHGARLLNNYIRRTRSLQTALLRYNGCVRGTNTPRCGRYPGRVIRTASHLRREMLATAANDGVIVPET
jgi:soluble lytic murein transglycosylase-like protein